MKKITLAGLSVSLLLVASLAFAASGELLLKNGKTEEYPAKFAAKSLRVSNFDIPVTIIADTGKTIRITSGIPITVAVQQRKGQMWIVGPVKNHRSNRGVSVSAGASASSYVHQETHGDQSPCVSGGGNVTINYGDGVTYDSDDGIIIRIPRWIHVETDNLLGSVEIR